MNQIKRVVIYQIGRLDNNLLNELEFEIEGMVFKTSLSSFALREYFKSQGIYDPAITLLYPVSLPLNMSLINERFKKHCPHDCYEMLNWTLENTDDYFQNPSRFFDLHPHSKEGVEYKIIHSLGEYRTFASSIKFNCYYHDIVIFILFEMIKEYLSNAELVDKIIVDISSGHNIYVSALIEALRYLITFIKLYEWDTQPLSAEIAFADPIFPESKRIRIYFETQRTKTFFSSPVEYGDIQNTSLARAIYPNKAQRQKKNELHSILYKFALAFSALKNNSPLVIFDHGYENKEKIENFMQAFLRETLELLSGSYSYSPNLNKSNYLKVIFACAFYLGMCKIFSKTGIPEDGVDSVEIERLRSCFKAIYNIFKLELNEVILGNEIDKIQKAIDKISNDWTPLLTCLYTSDKTLTSPQKRNFYAHAGFEGNLTECKKEEGKIFLRYRRESKKIIENWLYESI